MSLCLLEMTGASKLIIVKREYHAILFVDCSKAFDRINPNILFNKLSVLGIHHILINWIIGFLTYPKQRVRYRKYTVRVAGNLG